MKNYIISPLSATYLANDTCSNKYHYALSASESLLDYEKIDTSKFVVENREDFKKNWEDTTQRLKRYNLILAKRLNSTHCRNYSNDFWEKCFSLGLLKHITVLHQMFHMLEKDFKVKEYNFRQLHPKSFKYFNDFSSQRNVLNGTWNGQEQLFSIYIECFYPCSNSNFFYSNENHVQKNNYAPLRNGKNLRLKSFYHKLKCGIYKKELKIKLLQKLKNTKVGIMDCYFQSEYFEKLVLESNGLISRIKPIKIPLLEKIDEEARCCISRIPDKADRFDKFFFHSLKYLLPTSYLENFKSIEKRVFKKLDTLPHLEYLVSEEWLGSCPVNFFRAFGSEIRGIKTLYNEHNCIFHPFEGNLVNLKAKLVDTYLTFGWGKKERNFLPKSSLFRFKIKLSNRKKYNVLYVSNPMSAVYPMYSSSYSNWGIGAFKHLRFVKSFFQKIPIFIKKEISYRAYPKDYPIKSLIYDKEILMKEYINEVNFVNSMKFSGETCKQQMASSNIVIVDFLSTSYLEALQINVPTICFFDNDSMYLNEKFTDFFDDLIKAKIFHTTAQSAANHLVSIFEKPQEWWQDTNTQALKNRWLKRNFGKPDLLVEYLLDLAFEKKGR